MLCGFHEWPRSGIGKRVQLGLARGESRWTGELGGTGQAAIVGPETFLAGTQGYGEFRSVLVGPGGVVDRWDTHGPAVVTNRLRVVELRNVLPSDQRTVTLLPGGTLARGEALPGYHTAPPAALADGTLVTWRAGALLQIDADGAIARRHRFGPVDGAAGRIVVVGPGRLACVISDEDHGRGEWPLWIFPVDLPGLAAGPWPCDGGGPGDPGVLITPT